MPTEPSREQPSLADLGPYYVSAATSAALLGIPPGTIWASVWTPTEIRKSDRNVVVYLLLATMLEPDAAVAIEVPYADLRAAEGFAFKMLGAVTLEPSPTSWAIAAPTTSQHAGAYLVIEPWYIEVPIRVPGTTIPNSQPDAVAVRQRSQNDRVHYVDGHPRPAGKLIDQAMAVLDMRVRTGAPSEDSEAVRKDYLKVALAIDKAGDVLDRNTLAARTGLSPSRTYKRMAQHGVSIRGLKRSIREIRGS